MASLSTFDLCKKAGMTFDSKKVALVLWFGAPATKFPGTDGGRNWLGPGAV